MSAGKKHILIYEPRVEGHHVFNLQFVASDLLDAGFQLTLALDTRPESLARLRTGLGDILNRARVVSANDGKHRGEINFIASLLTESGADSVFLTNLDEIASSLLRRAAFGLMPPESLRGRLGGSYSRPRFLMGCGLSPNQWLKSRGFTKLLRGGWFRQLLFPDPFIAEDLAKQFPSVHIAHVPDPVPENFLGDREVARRELGLATDKKVFLFYGGAYRRKGLHLAVAALRNLPASSPTFLLCAGEQPDDADTARGIAELTAQGRALSLNRYISDAEEKLVFAACDFVLLPYIKHFGSSAVLSRAMGAGKPVIASDEELVGRVVRERGLGLLFPSGDVAALGRAMEQMAGAPVTEISRWQAAARSHAQKCSRAAFRDAVVGVFA